MNPVPKVFLSYDAADREPARRVGEHLRRAGFEVWDPEQEILPGADWMSLLSKALDSASAMVVFISPDAMESASVNREIEYALGAKHLRGRLIPVVLRPAKSAPWILDLLQPLSYDPSSTARKIVEILSKPAHVPSPVQYARQKRPA